MSRLHQYKKNPEFMNLEKFVWEGLNDIGRSIPQIKNDDNREIVDMPVHRKFKDKPIWHSKSELDQFVARRLNLKLEDYGLDLGKNQLYKAIANEVGRLRRADILVDWRRGNVRNTGMGVWHLDKTKLEKYVYKKASNEIKNKNFHSSGEQHLVFVRQKQYVFKRELISEYGKCVLCSFKIPEYMIGAHIVPYSVMREKDANNAMNPSNGLLLCRFCDVAFDRGSIMIKRDYGITIKDHLRDRREDIVKSWLEHIPGELQIKDNARYPPDPRYLKWKIKLLKQP